MAMAVVVGDGRGCLRGAPLHLLEKLPGTSPERGRQSNSEEQADRNAWHWTSVKPHVKDINTSIFHKDHNGDDTGSISVLSLRVLACRTRAALPSRAIPPTHTSTPADPASTTKSESITRRTGPDTDIAGRIVGWNTQCSTEEEDEPHEEET